ncbi:MAG: glycosyltransferase family 4 protein [Opitutales bacterium]
MARYVRGLLAGLVETAPPDCDCDTMAWQVVNFGGSRPVRILKTVWREMVWAGLIAPGRLRRTHTDLWHSTALPLIGRPPCRHVVTLHDLALVRHPERFRRSQVLHGRQRLRWVRHADHVIAVSQFTADEAMELLDIPARRITVVPNGLTIAPDEAVPADLPGEFFLFVDSMERAKNLPLLREIWLRAQGTERALPPLLIVGTRGMGHPEYDPPPADWRFLGHQTDEVLLALYRRAHALLFPSSYEGFGLPVLEAMAAGCPVICSRGSSLPEVAGEAAHFADLTAGGFGAAIHLLDSDPALRDQLRAAGRQQAGRFSWSKCATETAAVWRQVVGG